MADNIPPSLSTMDAPFIRLESASKPTEAELFEMEKPRVGIAWSRSRSLVAYSSSPPQLIEDCSGILEEHDDTKPEVKQSSLRSRYSPYYARVRA